MKQNETQKEPKSSEIFVCKCCDYNTSRRGQYDRHLATDKHQNRSNETNMKQIPDNVYIHCNPVEDI